MKKKANFKRAPAPTTESSNSTSLSKVRLMNFAMYGALALAVMAFPLYLFVRNQNVQYELMQKQMRLAELNEQLALEKNNLNTAASIPAKASSVVESDSIVIEQKIAAIPTLSKEDKAKNAKVSNSDSASKTKTVVSQNKQPGNYFPIPDNQVVQQQPQHVQQYVPPQDVTIQDGTVMVVNKGIQALENQRKKAKAETKVEAKTNEEEMYEENEVIAEEKKHCFPGMTKSECE